MKKDQKRVGGMVTVGEKGQIVIPKQVRDMFEIKPGDTLLLLADINRGIAIPPKEQLNTVYDSFYGGEENEHS